MRAKLLILVALAILLVALLSAPAGAEDLVKKIFDCTDGIVRMCPGPV